MMSSRVRAVTIPAAIALVILSALGSPPAAAASFSIGAEIGQGFKHNSDSQALIVRAGVLGAGGAGCGIILGTWNGEVENDVAGLGCEKRFQSPSRNRRSFSVGAGVVDITKSEIVNSDWALELHLRLFVTEHLALALTHFSNAGSERPNKGYNFVSLEVVF